MLFIGMLLVCFIVSVWSRTYILSNNPVCYSSDGMFLYEVHQKGPQMYPFEGDREYTIKYI